MGGGGKDCKSQSTTCVLADTESRDSAAAAAKEFLQQRSLLLKGRGSELAEVTNQLAPAPPKSLDGLVPGELLQESEGAAARRRLPYAELEAKKSQIEEARDALEPDFQEIARAVIADMQEIAGHLEGRDLQQHQPSCESLVSQSFQLLLDCLAASSKVDKPEELTVSLEAVKAAQEGYERCKRQFYGNKGNGAAQDDEEDDEDVLPDASTMSRCTDAFKKSLEVAYAMLEAHIRGQETQLEQNSDCTGAPELTAELACVKELLRQQREGRSERAKVDAIVKTLRDTDAAIAKEEKARQEALRMHSAGFSKQRQTVEQEQAALEEQIAKLTRSWQDLEATRKHLTGLEHWACEQQRLHAAKFESDKQWIADTSAKLSEKCKDYRALDSAIEAELALIKRVESMASSVVARYSLELQETIHADLKDLKAMFDSRYELYYRRQTNMQSQMKQRKIQLKKLKQKYNACVAQEDVEGAEQYKQRVAAEQQKINVLKAELEPCSTILVSLGEQWDAVFAPRQQAMRDRFGSFFDEREAIAVDVDKSLSNAVDEEIEMARQEAAAQRRAQEMRRKSIDERAARVLASRLLLQNGQS